MRSLAIITIAGVACFTFLACRQASRNVPFSAFLTIAWVMMSQGVWTQVGHHWFTTMFSMAGVWTALVYAREPDRRWRWPIIAGAAFGMGTASMVTPTCGAVAMLAGLTVFFPMRRHRAALIAYVLASALVPIGLLLWLVWHQALAAGFDDVILFTATHYAPIQGLPYGHWANERNAEFVCVFPTNRRDVLRSRYYAWRDRYAGLRDRMLAPCVAFGIAGFAACYPRPDIFHISFEVPLACPLLAYCAKRLTETWRVAYRAVAFGAVAGLFIRKLLLVLLTSQFMSSLAISPTPRGGLAIFGLDGAPQMLARIAALPPDDGWFFYSFIPMMPYLSAREHVSKYDILTPGFSLAAQYQEACESMMRHADWVVIDRLGTDPADLKYNFPMMRDPQPPETRAFELALDSSFEFVARDGIRVAPPAGRH